MKDSKCMFCFNANLTRFGGFVLVASCLGTFKIPLPDMLTGSKQIAY